MNADLASLNARVVAVNPKYQAVTVAWNDGSRGVENNMLSTLGSNITDARLVAHDGGVLPFVRPNNMDEMVGITTADKIMLVEEDGSQVTAHQMLLGLEERAKYMGYTSVDTNVTNVEPVVVRFQNVWVPLEAHETQRKLVPAHYSYQTRDRANPRNLIVLGTPSGIYVHSDAEGINRLYSHTKDEEGVNNHWFVAEESDMCVGQTLADVEGRSVSCKKGRFVQMGLEGMGTRANCFVIISIPNKQAPPPQPTQSYCYATYAVVADTMPVYRSLSGFHQPPPPDGISTAAIVSADTSNVASKAQKNPIGIVRAENEPIVVTIMVYNTVKAAASGRQHSAVAISSDDVTKAIDDMTKMYALCDTTCKLSELPVMLKKLTPHDKVVIAAKRLSEPVPPPVNADPFKPNANALCSAV